MNIKDYEFGYTPSNLRMVLAINNLKQKEAREVLAKGRNTFSRYLYDSDNINHVTMAHSDWLKLLQYIKNKNKLA